MGTGSNRMKQLTVTCQETVNFSKRQFQQGEIATTDSYTTYPNCPPDPFLDLSNLYCAEPDMGGEYVNDFGGTP